MLMYFLGFFLLISLLLALDLGVFHRKDELISAGSAIGWTIFWVIIALLFNVLIYISYHHHWLGIGTHLKEPITGTEAAIAYFTAYLVEKSLSIDNIFVMAMIFNYFRVPARYQHRVLFWGILGAILMRGAMIAAGVAAISMFHWLTYVLGVLLIITAIRMLLVQHDRLEPEKNVLVRLVSKILPITKGYHGHHFLVKIDGRWWATPLFLALLLIESTDLFFAIDSIPAVLAITLDPFIVLTSNVFAILGMRSLYFALASLMDRFRYLKTCLVFILGFVGMKMLLAHYFPIDTLYSLGVIVGILSIGIAASLLPIGRSKHKASVSFLKKYRIWQASSLTVRTVRKIFFLLAGITVLLCGVVMLILPGPGLLVIFLGLALLAVEFVWARVWISRIKERMHGLQQSATHLFRKKKK